MSFFTFNSKKSRLNEVIKSYKTKNFHNNEGEKIVSSVAEKVYKEKGHFTFGDIGEELVKTRRTYDLAGRYIKILIKKGLIIKIKRGVYVFADN